MMNDIDLNPRKRGLGRGLDALFESDEGNYKQTAEEEQASGLQRKIIGIEMLHPNPQQPRKSFNQDTLKELASSLKKYGVLQPLLVRPVKGDLEAYEIIAGERRWRAAQVAQLHEVPVLIREFSDSEALQIGLVENLQREDLNPIEEALGYRDLSEQFGYTQAQVAEIVGKSRSQVTNMMRLLSLPESVQDMVRKDEISTGHARALIGKDNAEDLAKRIRDQDISVREVEALTGKSKPSFKDKSVKDTDTRALESEISDMLGMDVAIDVKKGGQKGEVRIIFKSMEQLDYLLQKLSRT